MWGQCPKYVIVVLVLVLVGALAVAVVVEALVGIENLWLMLIKYSVTYNITSNECIAGDEVIQVSTWKNDKKGSVFLQYSV